MAEPMLDTTPTVTERDGVTGKVLPFPRTDLDSNAQTARTGARARLPVTERAGKRLVGMGDAARSWASQASATAATRSVWSDPPESLAEHASYIKAHPWSADFPLAIVAGCFYGWLAFLASVPLLTAVWLLRRPSRLFLATLVALVVWLTV